MERFECKCLNAEDCGTQEGFMLSHHQYCDRAIEHLNDSSHAGEFAFVSQLHADVRSISYDFVTRIGKIKFSDSASIKSSAVISIFEQIDENVIAIFTKYGDKTFVRFMKSNDGAWHARMPLKGQSIISEALEQAMLIGTKTFDRA